MDRRTWTDRDLSQAVASQSSWRGVLRALGLRGTSGKSIAVVRRHARRLDLNTDHFVGSSRKWSDRELRKAVSSSSDWMEVLEQLGLTPERQTWARVKGNAIRLGLETAALEASRPSRSGAPVDMVAEPGELRHAGPSIASAWFTLRRMPVCVPTEPQVYDLVVAAPEGFRRVQVKTTTCPTETGTWQVGIGYRPASISKRMGKVPYDPDSLDWFFIVDGDGLLYLIPMEAVAGMTTLHVDKYRAYRVGDVSGLLN